MITAILNLITGYWKPLLVAALMALLMVQSQRLTIARATVLELNTRISAANQIAQSYQEETERNLDTLRTALPRMVEIAQANAVINYKAKFGNRLIASCTGPSGVLPSGNQAGIDPADSSQGIDGISEEFILDCAHDTALLVGWQAWAKLNHLPIKE